MYISGDGEKLHRQNESAASVYLTVHFLFLRITRDALEVRKSLAMFVCVRIHARASVAGRRRCIDYETALSRDAASYAYKSRFLVLPLTLIIVRYVSGAPHKYRVFRWK